MTLSSDAARIQRKLRALGPKAEATIKTALQKSADEIVRLAQHLCPVDSGDLRKSIGWTWGDPPKGSMTLAESAPAESAGGLKLSIYAGDDKAFYARWVEFGVVAQTSGERITNASGRERKSLRTTVGAAAHPFFFPAYRSNKKRAARRIKRGISKAVKDNWRGN